MAREIIDISVAIRPGMPVYEGDPPVEITLLVGGGSPFRVSRLAMGTHAGTHVDAPAHLAAGAAGVDALPLDALIGPAWVADARHAGLVITAELLRELAIPPGTERLLLRTRSSELWDRPAFADSFTGLDEGAARCLVAAGCRLVGIDYLSIAPAADAEPAHRVLLEAGVVILEGLDLRGVEPGSYTLACLPLRIVGADGAPARAVLIRP